MMATSAGMKLATSSGPPRAGWRLYGAKEMDEREEIRRMLDERVPQTLHHDLHLLGRRPLASHSWSLGRVHPVYLLALSRRDGGAAY